MQIVFVIMAGVTQGMGHVFRSLTLAGELTSRAEISFVINDDDIAEKQIRSAGFSSIKTTGDAEIEQVLINLDPSIIIFDKLNVAEKLTADLKSSLKSKLVIFENGSGANKHASVVVNAVVNSFFKNTQYYDPETGTTYFCGPKYWIFRKEFLDFQQKRKKINSPPARIMLSFGGSDPANFSSKVLQELIKRQELIHLDLCLGSHFPYREELNSILAGHPDNRPGILLYTNPSNIAELMYHADLMITSPGTCAVEALSLGTPIIAINQNADQENAFEGYLNTISERDLDHLNSMIDAADFVYPDHKNIKEAAIGEGKDEVIQAIVELG